MKPGSLFEALPYNHFTAYYQLLTPNEYRAQLEARGTFFSNITEVEPGMVLLYVEDVYWFDQLWCKVLLNDRVCHLHGSLVNLTNFRTLDATMFEAM
jgi:hypothetical protein